MKYLWQWFVYLGFVVVSYSVISWIGCPNFISKSDSMEYVFWCVTGASSLSGCTDCVAGSYSTILGCFLGLFVCFIHQHPLGLRRRRRRGWPPPTHMHYLDIQFCRRNKFWRLQPLPVWSIFNCNRRLSEILSIRYYFKRNILNLLCLAQEQQTPLHAVFASLDHILLFTVKQHVCVITCSSKGIRRCYLIMLCPNHQSWPNPDDDICSPVLWSRCFNVLHL